MGINSLPGIRVSVFVACSLDGFIARRDGDVSWLEDFPPLGEGEDGGYAALFTAVDALVMGRKTFEKVLEFDWPYGEKPVIVLSRSPLAVPDKLRGSVSVDPSAPRQLLERLARQGYEHIYLDGGQLIQSFLKEGLVDDLTLTIVPVLLGGGIPLFGSVEKEIYLDLVETRSWENGFAQITYQVREKGL